VDNYSRAETIQGRKYYLLGVFDRRNYSRGKIFKGRKYSRAETIHGSTV
jgi:hypothetical protein